MAHLMLVERLKESVRAEQAVRAVRGDDGPDLGEALGNFEALINADSSLIPPHRRDGREVAAEQVVAEQAAESEEAVLRAALGLPPHKRGG